MEITRVETEGFDPAEMPFVPAVKVRGGTTIYLSGATAFPLVHSHPHREEELRVPEDIAAQTELTMENLGRALAAAGAGFEHVVKVVIYNTEMDQQDRVNAVYRRYFPTGLPARSHVGVSRLVGSGLKIEIEMVAVVPD
jgi:2-iminobutanoate/2-iminopropanoate deaminase